MSGVHDERDVHVHAVARAFEVAPLFQAVTPVSLLALNARPSLQQVRLVDDSWNCHCYWLGGQHHLLEAEPFRCLFVLPVSLHSLFEKY